MLGPQIVLIDANVFYSRTLRDWVGMLQAKTRNDVFRGRWTEGILAETIYHLRRNHPHLDGGVLTDFRKKIEKTFARGRVDSYEHDPAYAGKDSMDAHIHAAALACHATIVLTSNGRDLLPPSGDEDDLPYEIYAPDEFFMLIDQSAPDAVREVVAEQLKYYCEEYGEVDLPKRLRDAGAPKFAARIGAHLQTMPLPGSCLEKPVMEAMSVKAREHLRRTP